MRPSRQQGSAFRRHFAELDQSAPMHAETASRCAWLIAVATLTAACFGSEALYLWAFNLPLWTAPVRDGVIAVCETWHQAMTAIGLTDVHAALRALFWDFLTL